MPDWLGRFLEAQTLSPHGMCLLWRPELIWTHAVSDLLIGLAYFSIPLALGVFLHHRRDVRFGWAIWMFVLFIMLCGVTHFMMIWTLWNPDYGVEALIKAATALASVTTAVALWPLLPKAIAIPSSATLEARIAERDAALSKLQAAMATMVRMEEHQKQQARLLEDLNRSESRVRSLFENAAVGIARVAPDGSFLEVNDRYCEILGRPRQEVLAATYQEYTHPDDLEADVGHAEALLQGRETRYALDKRYLKGDGALVWIRLTVSLVRQPDGAPDHFVAIAEDITEEKRGLEAQTLLMREVDHRARNALAVVQSVVRLTDDADCEAYKAVVLGRVDALARAQAVLAKSQWRGGQLDDVVRQELSGLGPVYAWSAQGPSVELPAEHVQPLSMLVHELATNAIKHGALSASGGRVAVAWARTGAGWRLQWTESGGPVVTPPRRRGFGSRLVGRLATELGGTLELDWARSGLLATLTVGSQAKDR